MGSGVNVRGTDPRRQTSPPGPATLCSGSKIPEHQLQVTQQSPDMKVSCPRGLHFSIGEKNRLNYISKRYRRAEEEYQKRLGPGAEMPKMRI